MSNGTALGPRGADSQRGRAEEAEMHKSNNSSSDFEFPFETQADYETFLRRSLYLLLLRS